MKFLGNRLSYSFKEGGALVGGDAIEVQNILISERESHGRTENSKFEKEIDGEKIIEFILIQLLTYI